MAAVKRPSPFARLRSRLQRRCLRPPSIGWSTNSRMGLLRTARRGRASSDVPHLRSPRRTAVPTTTRHVSRNADGDDMGEGESSNENPSGDVAERKAVGKAVAFCGGKTDRLRAGLRAPPRMDTRMATASSEPTSSAAQPQCPTDACRNASSSSRSGRLVADGRSTRDLLDVDRDTGLMDIEMRLDALESGCLFAGRCGQTVSVFCSLRPSLEQVPDPT